MQQGNGYPTNSGRFVPGSPQVRQYPMTENLQVNVSAVQGGMQQSTNNVYPQTSNLCSGVSYVTQPPPYSTTATQLSPFQAPMNPVQHSPYQSPQPAFVQQQFTAVTENPAPTNLYQMPGTFPAPTGSLVPHGAPSLSPRAVSPRKSITGMMSPIRLPNTPMNMPPSSPVVAASGSARSPASPLSVYISGSQQFPRARQHSPRSFFPGNQVYNLVPPQSPGYHQPVPYSPSMRLGLSPASQFQTHPLSAPPSPQINPSPSQISPSLRHASPLSTPPQGMVAARPFKAARQLDMSPSFQDASAYSGGSSSVLPQPTINFTPLASSDAWNDVSAQSVVPSLPILSSDTLDLLSTLTVSTVSSPARSHSVSTVAPEPHMQRSPLLQQHLLMPKPPIKAGIHVGQQADPGPSPKTLCVYPEPTRVAVPVAYERKLGIEDPPSRSNHMHNAIKSPISKEEKEKKLTTERSNSSANSCTITDTPSIVKTVAKSEDFTSVELATLTTMADNMSVGDGLFGVLQTTSSSNTLSDAFVKTSHATTATTVSLSTVPVACVTTAAVGSPITTVTAGSGMPKAVESPPPVPEEILGKREKICKEHKADLKEKLANYNEYLTELFFLQNGGNYMDFIQFKKRPSHKLLEYLKRMAPDAQAVKNRLRKTSQETLANGSSMSPSSDISSGSKSSRKALSDDGKVHKAAKTSEPFREERKMMKPSSQRPSTRESRLQETSDAVPTISGSSNRRVMTGSAPQSHLHQQKGAVSPLRLMRLARHNTSSSALDESIGSQEEILERAKQEAVIQRKVVELRKQGLWTQRRLPKVQEPPRNKTHWDYLLEEMRWLSADFAQERKWKRAAARKLVRTVAAYHKEQHDKVIRAEREEQNRLRRIASTMAREIRIFWSSIGKVVEYKQRSLLDEKRQKALDLHLSYIVDQTEKYSDWLTQGLNKQVAGDSSPTRSRGSSSKRGSDDEFLPQGESSDDEETIAIAEQEIEKSANEEDEISILKQESQLPFDELLNSLPPELIENIGKPLEAPGLEAESPVTEKESVGTTSAPHDKPDGKESDEEGGYSDGEIGGSKPTPISLRRSARKRKISEATQARKDSDDVKKTKLDSESNEADQEFNAEESGEDDEATVEEEEMKEDAVDHEKEIQDLQAEGEMPIEELMKMYAGAFDEDAPKPEEESEEEEDGDDEEDHDDIQEEQNVKEESSDAEESDGANGNDLDEEIGMDYLFKADVTKDDNMPMILPKDETEGASGEQKKAETTEQGSPNKEITDVAAEAASLQPTGFTLATTQVVTPIPVLLKHTLREYQHIGLDWLVTMYDKRLNGILADEMGLGKTIQTIALLAHLACEKGVWGPHLIVVPTSVMLNWEMEFKKWCPGFKILTYYGSQKERKAKRTGWTKSNAFHVCITSYKLVLQDNVSFRRKKWKYLVLDEAQNIKNFKSQRWQTLLNFNSQRRLLLTGTPLQNNLMELWSLMHFLMPHVFQSHKEFKEWFSNPLTGMIEGSQDYNEKLVRRLHKVLRPFLLRRIKKDVEKQMPNKYEHVIRCHLSKRQRFLYEDFMSRAATKDTLTSGHFMSVINVLMQLRKVCNHPNLFEPRSIISPFLADRINFETASLVTKAMEKGPFEELNLQDHSLHLPTLCNIHRYNAERAKRLQIPRKLIEELDCESDFVAPERPHPKSLPVREQLSNLLKEREKQRAKNTTLSLHLTQGSQQLPVLTLPTQFATASGARVLTIPQSKTDGETFTIAGAPSSRSGTVVPQGFTLQYQTPQGTKVTIPNKQIRHLPGGMVQIVTAGMTTKGDAAIRVDSPLPASQSKAQEGSATRAAKMDVSESDELASLNLGVHENEAVAPNLYSEVLKRCRAREQKERLARMARMNGLRCEEEPSWLPCDTVDFLKNIFRRPTDRRPEDDKNGVRSSALVELVKPYETKLTEYTPIADRFVFVVPKVQCTSPCLHVPHPSPSASVTGARASKEMFASLNKVLAPFHSVRQAMMIQFPEARLIQYDCGKLQVLNVYLRRFWAEKHRCLIFTQMTKVLDILEAFLSYHGYRYLRLDGSTRVEQRMSLMERFNNDPRIFCFILSTRSGGVGVNLTGADTVIFYDSDWNPTMDAQAQDRCHRIGQTRDVNIYRLISERTVEENILKKANQKRLLGDLAIEGGSFTTAFFKEQAIKDLFNEPTGLEELSSAPEKEGKAQDEPVAVLSKPVTARQKAIAAAKEAEAKAADTPSETKEVPPTSGSANVSVQVADKAPKATPSTWEDALQETEDKEDVDAAKLAKEEQDAEMDEFLEERNADGEDATEGQVSKLQEELKSLYEELTPVEQYALRYLEETTEEVNREELELAEEQVHQSKKDWEISHLMALKEEEERRLEEEDEIFYTREDAENQVYIDDVTGETMPIWFPPTPPQDENDVYIDPITCLLYRETPMLDDQLPVIAVKKERKRTKTEHESPGGITGPKRKLSRAEIHAPKSLFNRPLSHLKKRDSKSHKFRPPIRKVPTVAALPHAKPVIPASAPASADKENVSAAGEPTSAGAAVAATPSSVAEAVTTDAASTKSPEWLINEDWKLLQAVQQVLEMPLSLVVMMPAHTPNWDLVADIVNSISSVFRSPKMCKQRFENVIAPREEGRSSVEISLKKKLKGTKTLSKLKASKPQKTTSMHLVDNNFQHTTLYSSRFDAIKEVASRRSVPSKSSGSGQFQRNPKHASILMENGIAYDKPLPPVQVASLRAERIAREKQAIEAAKQQQLQSQTMQHTNTMSQLSTSQVTKTAGISTSGISQLTAIPLSGGASNIIVNSSALSALTKKMSQQQNMAQFSVATPKTAKATLSGAALQQTLLRSASNGAQTQQQLQQPQIQIQQQSQVGTMVTVGLLHRLSNAGPSSSMTTAVANNNTITLSSLTRPSITVPAGAFITSQQQIQKQISQQLSKQQQQQRLQQQQTQLQLQKQQQKKTMKPQITPQRLQITPEAMKQLRKQQQLEASVVTVTKLPGKQRKTTPITQQELEQLLAKNPAMRRSVSKGQTAQVQIAPAAQIQAQQVQVAAAQQAAQQVVTSKPLPITVPVSNLVSVAAVNLGGVNIATSTAGTSVQQKSLQVPMNIQQQLFQQRQVMKQRLVPQQQPRQGPVLASKVAGKQTVYAMVAGTSITQGKRRSGVASTSGTAGSQQQTGVQQPVQLTVTKLLQSQAVGGQPTAHIKQAFVQQGAQAVGQQQIRTPQMAAQLQQQQVSATIVPSNMTQHRLITPQRQVRQIQQLVSNQQMVLAQASPAVASSQQFSHRQNPSVVASISIPAVSGGAAGHLTLSSPTQQSGNQPQQLQNLPQVQMRAQGNVAPQQQARTAMQPQLVLSQISPQAPLTSLSTPVTPTTMTLAPSLVQLPIVSTAPTSTGSQAHSGQVSLPSGTQLPQ